MLYSLSMMKNGVFSINVAHFRKSASNLWNYVRKESACVGWWKVLETFIVQMPIHKA